MAKQNAKAKPSQTKATPIAKKKYLLAGKVSWIDLLYIFILLIVVLSVYNKVYDKKLWLGGDNAVYYITGKAIAKAWIY